MYVRHRVLVVAALSACAIGCTHAASTEDIGPREDPESSRQDIVGGAQTSAFEATGALTRFGGTHCTGTLITPRKVLTAAHCLAGVSASSLRFVIGPNVSSPQYVLNVASVTPHPQYNDSQLTNDIGYVTLTQDAPVAPMKIVAGMSSSWVGTQLVFVGYGITSGNGGGAGTKRSVTMPIATVSAKQFSYQTQGKNTCNGDSGGPAFAKVGSEYHVAGVTSYGDAGCTQYGVDTRTDVFASFLGVQPGGGGGGSGGSGGTGGGGGSGGSSGSSGSGGASGSGGTSGSGGAPSDPCQGETYEGRCNGSTVIWCDNQQIHQQSCAATGEECGFSSANGYYECLAPDPCKGETFDGRCQGNTVIWCENAQVKSISCQSCGFDQQKGYYNCL